MREKWGQEVILDVMETDLGGSRYEMEDRFNNNNNPSKKLTSKRSHLHLAQSTPLL